MIPGVNSLWGISQKTPTITMKTFSKTPDHTSPATRRGDIPPADWQADADLWRLLGRTPQAELSPGFDDAVFRGIAKLERRNPRRSALEGLEQALHLLLRRVALPLAAAAMVAAALISFNRPDTPQPSDTATLARGSEAISTPPAETAGDSVEEFELVANLHNIITTDESESWLMASMDFSDGTL